MTLSPVAGKKDTADTQGSPVRPKTAQTTKRLPSAERQKLIVQRAASFFAEHGFDATTRDLAKHLGTTQPLLYKYFKGKDDLIDAVYKNVFLDVWDSEWDVILSDRNRPIIDRLIEFYRRYTDVIMERGWLRIYLFAGLKGVAITGSYIKLVEERLITRIVTEISVARGIDGASKPDARMIEIGWALQGSIFYHGVRKFAYGLEPHVDKNVVIGDVVRIFVEGWPSALKG